MPFACITHSPQPQATETVQGVFLERTIQGVFWEPTIQGVVVFQIDCPDSFADKCRFRPLRKFLMYGNP